MRACIVHHQQIVRGHTGGLQQRYRLCLCIERVKACRFARCPVPRRALACQNDASRDALVARAIGACKVAPSDLKQSHG